MTDTVAFTHALCVGETATRCRTAPSNCWYAIRNLTLPQPLFASLTWFASLACRCKYDGNVTLSSSTSVCAFARAAEASIAPRRAHHPTLSSCHHILR